MKQTYHLALNRKDLEGARIALLPGDPFRVPAIADKAAELLDGRSRELAWKREYRSHLLELPAGNAVVISTGIGGPSTAICVEELALLGVDTFVRVGTCGAIQPWIAPRDLIVAEAAVRLEGTSSHYAPPEYPAAACMEISHALLKGARSAGVRAHAGVMASSDSFYPGQERHDSYSGYTIPQLRGSMTMWQKLGILAYEMEAATLFVVARTLGLRAGCIAGVLVNRADEESITTEALQHGEDAVIRAAVPALGTLLKQKQDEEG
jgi:uridine phosphorylase